MADEGATPRELVLEACRRNNTELLVEVINGTKPTSTAPTEEAAVAELLNNTRDGMGNWAVHVAASSGSYDVLDVILDQPGVEVDPLDRISACTPLHKAVEYANSLDWRTDEAQADEGLAVVEILVDAGCDPRIRDKGKRKPIEAVDPRNEKLRNFLRRAETLLIEGEGVVDDDEEDDAADADPPSDSE